MSSRALQIEKSIEETKRSILEREAAVTNSENGATDLKEKVENLTKTLEEHEKDYQVTCQNKLPQNIARIRQSSHLTTTDIL